MGFIKIENIESESRIKRETVISKYWWALFHEMICVNVLSIYFL